MAFTGNENQVITLNDAAKLTKNYRSAMSSSSSTIAHYFAKSGVESVLSQDGCVGIRIYYGLTDAGEQQLVLVGVDSSQNDLYNGIILDRTLSCPMYCSSTNALNS